MHTTAPLQSSRAHWAGALALALGFAASAHAALAPAGQAGQSAPSPQLKGQVQAALGGLSVPFEANSGQWDAQVAFKAQTFAGQVFVTHSGSIVYSLPGPVQDKAADSKAADRDKTQARTPAPAPIRAPGWSLVETLVGAQNLTPSGSQAAPTHISRFQGNSSYQAATYHSVNLGQAWPGVAVELSARGNNVEKLFHVAPGANPGRIQVQLQGAKALRLGEQGQLIASTGHGDVAYTAPVAYQTINDQRIDVPVRYVLGKGKQHSYQFALGEYDRSAPLVIDPLIQSTYLGGSGMNGDQVNAMAVASNGDVLVAGSTQSTDFPGTLGGAQAAYSGGDGDAFVARLSGDLKTLVQSTYLGGSTGFFGAAGGTYAHALALAGNGDALVGGYTCSNSLPGTIGGAQPSTEFACPAYVTRFSGDLTILVQSTYFGDESGVFLNNTHIRALTVTSNGDVLAAGDTDCGSQHPFCHLGGATGGAQATIAGGFDSFVARLSGDLKTIVQSTYLGGSGNETYLSFEVASMALAVASNGDILVTGMTLSADFPGTTDGAQANYGGGGSSIYGDAFVARLSADLKTLKQSTYLGGGEGDFGAALAVASNGDVLIAGMTQSTDFPGTLNGAQAALGGTNDAFVSRLTGDLKTVVQSTYLGGGNFDQANVLALASDGDLLVAGMTASGDFPGTSEGVQAAMGGGIDGFVTRLSGDLKTLVQSTYLGGSSANYIYALSLTSNGDLKVAGTTDSLDFPGTSDGAQAAYGGGYSNGFVARLSSDLKAVSPQTITFGAQPGQTFASGGSFALNPVATASSGLPVSYTSTTPSVCTISGTTVTMVSTGTCTIQATQAGDASWQAATPVSQSVTLAAPVATARTPIPVNAPWALLLVMLGLAGLGMRGLRGRQ